MRHFRVWESRFVIVKGKSKVRENPLLMFSDTDPTAYLVLWDSRGMLHTDS